MRESTIGEPANTTCVLGQGQFADAESAGFEEELAEVEAVIAALPPGPVLDVACGTGFLTRHLRGSVVALDQSESMLAIARPRLPDATLVRGDALRLPFPDNSFDRVFTANFYGHLEATTD
jgi:ubiquinone/menaquinone biosynthesis C-methylase UbiE